MAAGWTGLRYWRNGNVVTVSGAFRFTAAAANLTVVATFGAFAGAEKVILPLVPRWSRPVYHLYVVRVAERARVQKALAAAGIGTGIHYPTPLHLSRAYQALHFRAGDFPVAEHLSSRILSLPMFPELSEDSQRRVAHLLLDVVR